MWLQNVFQMQLLVENPVYRSQLGSVLPLNFYISCPKIGSLVHFLVSLLSPVFPSVFWVSCYAFSWVVDVCSKKASKIKCEKWLKSAVFHDFALYKFFASCHTSHAIALGKP